MYCTVLIYCNHNLFQNHTIIPSLFGDCLNSSGDIYMICSKDHIQKFGMESLYGHEKFLAGWSAMFVLGEWVVKIDLLANRSTHWPVGLTYSPSSTHWPITPTCWPTGRLVGQQILIGR